MAKLRIFKSIENGIYVLRFENDPSALSNSDKELMQKFGEPEINLGGVFLGGTGNEFTLPDVYVKIRNDFPVRQEFDSRSTPFNTNTVVKVTAYKDEIVSRFDGAMTDLRASTDTFTGENIENV